MACNASLIIDHFNICKTENMLTGIQSDNFQKSSSEISFEQVCAQVNHFFRSTFPKIFSGKNPAGDINRVLL